MEKASAIPLSAVVIAFNEERNIRRCVESLAFAAEVIVVDSESRDSTREIAESLGARVVVAPWRGYSDQKNLALTFAKHDWVLSIDADEEVSPELREEILSRLSSAESASVVAFTVPRKTIHFQRWIRFGGWYPNRLTRLFRKSQGCWAGGFLHEYWDTRGLVQPLKHPLNHFSFYDLADQIDRNNHYSSLGAEKLLAEHKAFSVVKLLTKPVTKFLELYLLKQGFRDAMPGFIIAVSAAFSVFLKWAKLWEYQNRASR